MGKIKVGILRGGPSSEHEVSLKTGEAVLANLPEQYTTKDIFIDQKGEWYVNGRFTTPDRVLHSVDVVFNALHGYFGEDGKVQQILESFKVPYTGSGILSSAMGMNKILSRDAFIKHGLNTPRAFVSKGEGDPETIARKALAEISPSWVVKPASSGSSVGISIAHNFVALVKAIEEAVKHDSSIIIEEYIKGRETTCGIIDGFRGIENYALPVIEIIPHTNHSFFNYEAKYGGKTKEVCPANLHNDVKREIEKMARQAHEALGCRHYSRADFMISERARDKGKIYLLEVNTLPGLTSESLLPKAVKAVGSSYPELLDHLIKMALKK